MGLPGGGIHVTALSNARIEGSADLKDKADDLVETVTGNQLLDLTRCPAR